MRNVIGHQHCGSSRIHGAGGAPDMQPTKRPTKRVSEVPRRTIAPTPHRSPLAKVAAAGQTICGDRPDTGDRIREPALFFPPSKLSRGDPPPRSDRVAKDLSRSLRRAWAKATRFQPP